jgi:hypothetical protein
MATASSLPGLLLACARSNGAQRYDEFIRLVDSARFNWWHYRRWGVDALMAQGLPAEALRYAQGSQASMPHLAQSRKPLRRSSCSLQ